MTIRPGQDPVSHVLYSPLPPPPGLSGTPLTCKRKEEKTHMCWAEEQRGEEPSEESPGDGRMTGCGNTPLHSLLWQKNKHRATKLAEPRANGQVMTFLTVTRRPSGKRGQGPTNGRARPEPDTVVLWVSGPLGRVSHNLSFPHECWTTQVFLSHDSHHHGPMGGKWPLADQLLLCGGITPV